jgi:alanyl-tRNA synthetase
MGDQGPCGPCSEKSRFYEPEEEEKALASSGKILVNADHPQVVEIWNNSFLWNLIVKPMVLFRKFTKKHVRYRNGFERLCMVYRKNSKLRHNRCFTLIEKVEQITGFKI